MSEPHLVQLALQGGGAKISAILAAMEVVEKLHVERKIRVTKIAGTSAGAIVGALFAAGVPLSSVKTYLEGGAGLKLAKLFSSGKVSFGKNLVRFFTFGSPFWETEALANGLNKFFSERDIVTFDDLKNAKKGRGIEMSVVATNLTSLQKETYDGTRNVVESLLDTSGLPFCFRTHRRRGGGSVVVDGGICENLPIGDLSSDEDNFGPVIAFTFQRVVPVTPPSSALAFSKALLEAAMNNSVERARLSLKPARILELPTEITTFEFKRAVDEGLKGDYKHVKFKTEIFFEKFLKDQQAHGGLLSGMPTSPSAPSPPGLLGPAIPPENAVMALDPWSDPNPTVNELMLKMGRIYRAQHEPRLFKYSNCTYEVFAYSLLPSGHPQFGAPDVIAYFSTFEPHEEVIDCLAVVLITPPEPGYIGKTSWHVTNSQGERVKLLSIPVKNPEEPLDREVVHFFSPPIQPGAGSHTFMVRDEMKDIMSKFKREGQDDIVFMARRAMGKIDRINLLLHVPKECTLQLTAREGSPQGRRMLHEEEERYETPDGFVTYGWIGEDVEAQKPFGVDFSHRKDGQRTE